jgi:hypothetical protein
VTIVTTAKLYQVLATLNAMGIRHGRLCATWGIGVPQERQRNGTREQRFSHGGPPCFAEVVSHMTFYERAFRRKSFGLTDERLTPLVPEFWAALCKRSCCCCLAARFFPIATVQHSPRGRKGQTDTSTALDPCRPVTA